MAKLNVGDEEQPPTTGDTNSPNYYDQFKPNVIPESDPFGTTTSGGTTTGGTYITDAEAAKFQAANNIRSDAISVRTSSGSIVWVDPSYPNIAKSYQTGVYTGSINEEPPYGVLAIMYSTTKFRTYDVDPRDPTVPKYPPIVPNLPPPMEPNTPTSDPTTPTGPNIPPSPIPDTPTGPNIPPTPLPEEPTDGPTFPPPQPYEPPPPEPAYIPNRLTITVNLTITPYVSPWEPEPVYVPWSLTIEAIPMPLLDAIMLAVQGVMGSAVDNYFDETRVGKTLLNFGQDYQALLLNWKLVNSQHSPDPSLWGNVIVKLYEPLPPEVAVRMESWISRELSPSYLDQIFVVYLPSGGVRLYLRPANRSMSVQSLDGMELNNVTNQTLFSTGSSSPTDLTDPVLEQWFTTALEGAELNIDYTDFNQFVFYSSATKRLEAFKQKLSTLEEYDTILTQQSASMATASLGTGLAGFTGSAAYGSYQRISDQRIDLIRSFDGYERFLYYTSGSAYSSSFSPDKAIDDEFYYISDATWPKVNGVNISVASASNADLYSIAVGYVNSTASFLPGGDYSGLVSWWDAMTYIADEYDRQNPNRLVNNLPEYLRDDSQSDDFLTFIDMVGHHFDVLKVYADDMPQIYDRDNDPVVGMSQDMVWNIASSFGVDLPNQYAVKALLDYTIGDSSITDPTIYRQSAAETWKRFLHNQIYLLKTKGTAASLRGLMNAYGVLPTAIQIREAAAPSYEVSQSYELIEEQTNALLFTSGTHIDMPFSSSVKTVQVRFATTSSAATQTVFNVDNSWGVRLTPISASYGRVTLVNAAGTAVTASALLDIFGGEYYTVTLQSGSTDGIVMRTQRADATGEIVDSSIVSASFTTWASGNASGSVMHLGSSGSLSFLGNVDETRVWSEQLSDTTMDRHVQYPALYNGNTTTSARDQLLIRLSFNIPQNLFATSSLPNESPYIRVAGRSAAYNSFTAIGFPNSTTYPYSTEVITRNILRYTPNTGASQYVSNKIIIADPPVLRYVANDSGSLIPVLSNEKSMVTVYEKPDNVLSNNTIGFYFSIQDAINDSMIRTLGNIDLQSYIGDPSDMFRANYADLKTLNELYWTTYAYQYNYNSFVDFVDDLLQPMFTQARSMVPARAKLLTGIVLESPMLERNKIQWNLPEVDDTEVYYPDALTSQPNTVSGDFLLEEAEFTQTLENPLAATYDVLDADWNLEPDNTIDASLDSYSATIDMLTEASDGSIVGSDFLVIDSITDEYAYVNVLLNYFNVTDINQLTPAQLSQYNQLMATHQPGPTVAVQTGMNPDMPANIYSDAIEPYVDFLQIAATNYFTQVAGVFKLLSSHTVRLNQAILTDAGTWTAGTTYFANQYVIQTGVTGAGSEWNGTEFVCITPRAVTNFVSYVAPGLDTVNWRKVKYTTEPTYTIRTATEVNGLVQLADPAGGYTPFIGYNSHHYRYFRDTTTGTIRHNWDGCKTTDDNTFDGGPAVEVISSAGDILVVTDGAEPIQRTSPNSGPRLDVK